MSSPDRLDLIIDAVVAGLRGTLTGTSDSGGTPVAPAAPPVAAPPLPGSPPLTQVVKRSDAGEATTPVAVDPPAAGSAVAGSAGPDGPDVGDPTAAERRASPGVKNPRDPRALEALMGSTCARIGVGRAGPRYRTPALLLFQADHAVAKDAIYRSVDQRLLDELGLFTVTTRVADKEEYLLRPDLGRLLSDTGRQALQERCVKGPKVQVVVGDGLSAAAIEANAARMMPVLMHGFTEAGLATGTPFFVEFARVGLMNDINTIVGADVIVYLIGERPGLGRATSMSVYLGYKPAPGLTDADRDVVCNIFDGGTNPLEAGAYVVQLVRQMIAHQASGVKLKLATMRQAVGAEEGSVG